MQREVEIYDDIFLPCYLHLFHGSEIFDIDFLYGGRDSGKSRHIAMQLIIECMTASYFKCLMIRKVLNTVRDSQYNLIKSIIEDWGLSELFSFNDTRLEIRYKENGNGFYGRGLDDVGRIKSFNSPSHCWIEEGNQITADDFVVVLTSLRAEQRVKTWFSFNPECEMNYTDFWLYQEWFSHTTDLSFTWNKSIDVDGEQIEFKIRTTHTTYRDNPYCTPQRKALYESYKNSKNNAYWYQTFTLGLWGYKRTGGEFWKCFEETKHVRDSQITSSTIHIVVDNNVNPYITVDVWQIELAKKKLTQAHEIPCSHPDNTASKAAMRTVKWLRQIQYNQPVYLYGDPSANAKSTVDDNGKSFFDKYRAVLVAEGFKIVDRIQRSAPEVAQSGSFINEIYESSYMGWSIEINSTCRSSIEDYVMAKEDAEGKILKKRETDPETKVSFERYGHHSDCKRYFITTVLANEFNQYKSRGKRGPTAVPRNFN